MDSNSIKICLEARERGITALYHFTPLPNLPSILADGLASRQVLDAHGVSYWYTDDWRADGRADALSLSIQEINRSMFSAKIRTSRCRWAILEIAPSVLWTHSCRFCWANASSGPVLNYTRYLGGPWGFRRMFEDCTVSAIDSRWSRGTFGTPDNRPTLNDAEVQVFTPIDPDLIVDVTVASECDRVDLEVWMKANDRVRPVAVYPDIFAAR